MGKYRGHASVGTQEPESAVGRRVMNRVAAQEQKEEEGERLKI